MGGALSVLAEAMLLYSNVQVDKLPRMADFTRWGYTIAEALGYEGERFLQAYQNNRNQSNDVAVSSNPVAAAVIALMKDKNAWSGSVAKLLTELEVIAFKEKIDTDGRLFPKAAHILRRRLKDVKSNLEDVGIAFEISLNGNYKKVTIKRKTSHRLPKISDKQPAKVAKRPVSPMGSLRDFQRSSKAAVGRNYFGIGCSY